MGRVSIKDRGKQRKEKEEIKVRKKRGGEESESILLKMKASFSHEVSLNCHEEYESCCLINNTEISPLLEQWR